MRSRLYLGSRILHIAASVAHLASQIDTATEVLKQAIMGICDSEAGGERHRNLLVLQIPKA